ncbi:PspC domain-containing protein [Pontibacter sp. G13]|uniref:PspC domain-containing protein n=1 Tax=Pontibacter sp. G13 TaxID=3074898 RepID=UPI00288B6264|nr:PspC domain-containing protein [Pontibacter sp. G13]WNJ19254.1 PspC domain-containing protein [Pontibacter sp. G13]
MGKPVRFREQFSRGQKVLKRKNGSLTGVCAGIGDYLGIHPRWIRAGFVISAFFTTGLTVLGYIVMAVALPREQAHERYFDPESYQDPAAGLDGTDEMEIAYQQDRAKRRSGYSDRIPAEDATPVCWNCDSTIKASAKYCHKCGARVDG